MATYADNLTTARDNMAAILAEITVNPKPSYSIDGEQVSWSEYQAMLMDKMEQLTLLINGATPYQVQTRAYT